MFGSPCHHFYILFFYHCISGKDEEGEGGKIKPECRVESGVFMEESEEEEEEEESRDDEHESSSSGMSSLASTQPNSMEFSPDKGTKKCVFSLVTIATSCLSRQL